jgi:threonine dehydratase
MDSATPIPFGIADIERAAGRIAGHAVLTPLLGSPALDRVAGRRILLKAEPLQRTGSFKFRGAFNRIAMIPEAERGRGVIAFSSGNHAQGVAAAAALHGIPASIVMPADAPAIKRRSTEAWGATVVPYDRATGDREALTAALAAESGATIVRPYDDHGVMAGQGTIGLEIAQQCAALGLRPDAVIVCCGGGGLISGTATALADRLPGVPVYAAEPAGFDDTRRSLESGTREANDPAARTICDGLMAPTPGALTFAVNRQRLSGGFAADDDRVRAAMAAAFEHLKLVLEPSGAVALAVALDRANLPEAAALVCVATGGNVDPETYRTAISGSLP